MPGFGLNDAAGGTGADFALSRGDFALAGPGVVEFKASPVTSGPEKGSFLAKRPSSTISSSDAELCVDFHS